MVSKSSEKATAECKQYEQHSAVCTCYSADMFMTCYRWSTFDLQLLTVIRPVLTWNCSLMANLGTCLIYELTDTHKAALASVSVKLPDLTLEGPGGHVFVGQIPQIIQLLFRESQRVEKVCDLSLGVSAALRWNFNERLRSGPCS